MNLTELSLLPELVHHHHHHIRCNRFLQDETSSLCSNLEHFIL